MNLCIPRLLTMATLAVAGTLSSVPGQAQFFQQGPKLVGTGAIATGQGYSVSLSANGNTAIVGGPSFDSPDGTGAAWVYARSRGVWTQQAKLVGTGAISSLLLTPAEGSSVSLSADGNTAIVGGEGDNFQGTAPTGAAWIFTRSGAVWTQQGPKLVATDTIGFASQGSSVSISADGGTAIVGGPLDNVLSGAAWVYTRTGGVWTQQAKLIGTGVIGVGAAQGSSVSLSADGNTAIVGGPSDGRLSFQGNLDVGAAWVFTRSEGVWAQQAKLIARDAIGFANQGFSVSLSADGNSAIIGGPFDDNGPFCALGAAWVYTRASNVWTQQAKLIGTGVLGPCVEQGWSVSISGDGNTAIIGGRDDNEEDGAAWVFTRSGGTWTQQGKKLVGTGAVNTPFPANQGFSVSLSGDGNSAIVGGPSDNAGVGAAWVFTQPVFAGVSGKANCHGQSVSALARQYGGLNGAAAGLGYADVSALQNAIMAFCGG